VTLLLILSPQFFVKNICQPQCFGSASVFADPDPDPTYKLNADPDPDSCLNKIE
jgi:hypothetical protein